MCGEVFLTSSLQLPHQTMVRNQVAKHFENMLGVPKEAGDGALHWGSVAVFCGEAQPQEYTK